MTSELTLPAALRDIRHPRGEVRTAAIRNLVPAYLETRGLQAPVWKSGLAPSSAENDPQHREVLAAIEATLEDPFPPNSALALIALGQLGHPRLIEDARVHLADTSEKDDEKRSFRQECAVIALSLLGSAAHSHRSGDGRDPQAASVEADIRALLEDALNSRSPALRFQAGPALAELGEDESIEKTLVTALRREELPELRANLVRAIATFDPPGAEACDALIAALEEGDREKAGDPLSYEAALALASARRSEATPRLRSALSNVEERDRALEALAVLGPHIASELREQIALPLRRILSAWLMPGFTKVRAAYALSTIAPDEGRAALDRLSKSLRPSVRQAVDEARALLSKLELEPANSQ